MSNQPDQPGGDAPAVRNGAPANRAPNADGPADPARAAADLLADEAQLVARAIDGSEPAITALLERFGPQVRHRLIGKIATTWQAVLDLDDVMQVTYLEAFLQIENFKPKGGNGAFLAWLTQVAENNLRDAVRGLERAKRPNPRNQVHSGPAEDSYVALVELLGVTNSTPSRQAGRGELRAIIDQVLCELPPDYEQVIRVMDLDGRPAADAAAEIGRSTGAIHMLRARAHERLKSLLGNPSRFFSSPG